MVPIVCKILERHPITHEPWKLQVIGYQETLDVTNHSEYAILHADKTQFYLASLPSVPKAEE